MLPLFLLLIDISDIYADASAYGATCPRGVRVWNEDCNRCWCRNGRPKCTKKICSMESAQKKSGPISKPGLISKPGGATGVNGQVNFDFGDYSLDYGRGVGDYGQEDYQLDPTGYNLEQGFGRGTHTVPSLNYESDIYEGAEYGATCPRGVKVWNEDCNRCWCRNGRPKCTKKICAKELYSPSLYSDIPDISDIYGAEYGATCPRGVKVWNEDCNRCWCRNGRPKCTKKICSMESAKKNSGPISKPGLISKPGGATATKKPGLISKPGGAPSTLPTPLAHV